MEVSERRTWLDGVMLPQSSGSFYSAWSALKQALKFQFSNTFAFPCKPWNEAPKDMKIRQQ